LKRYQIMLRTKKSLYGLLGCDEAHQEFVVFDSEIFCPFEIWNPLFVDRANQ